MVDSIPSIGGGTAAGIYVTGLIMFVVLIPFFAFGEIGRNLGGDHELYKLFFVRRVKYVPVDHAVGA